MMRSPGSAANRPGEPLMYEPSHVKVEDREALHGVIRAHPLATLVTVGPEGLVKAYGFGRPA